MADERNFMLPRAQLAKLFREPEVIRAFEALFANVARILPADIALRAEAAEIASENATILAQSASTLIVSLVSAIEMLASAPLPHQPLQQDATGLDGAAELRAELQVLRRRVDDLEATP